MTSSTIAGGALLQNGVLFSNNGALGNPKHIRLQNLTVRDAPNAIGIEVNKVIDLTISQAQLLGTAIGVHFTVNTKLCRVIDGVINGSKQHGISFDGGELIEIRGTQILNSSTSADLTYSSIFIATVNGLTIANNRLGRVNAPELVGE